MNWADRYTAAPAFVKYLTCLASVRSRRSSMRKRLSEDERLESLKVIRLRFKTQPMDDRRFALRHRTAFNGILRGTFDFLTQKIVRINIPCGFGLVRARDGR